MATVPSERSNFNEFIGSYLSFCPLFGVRRVHFKGTDLSAPVGNQSIDALLFVYCIKVVPQNESV